MYLIYFKIVIMKPTNIQLQSLCSFLMLVLQIAHVLGGSQFSSHVTVNTPARSYSHGVGDPLPSNGRRYQRPLQRSLFKNSRYQALQNQGGGYPRIRPSIPFNNEERTRTNDPYNISPWQQKSFQELPIPVLPPSPYKVDSPDPESLWPEGLFLPPLRPHNFAISRRSDPPGQVASGSDPLDPYLLEGSEAIAAVQRAEVHGLLYFHDIPHIDSLLDNQELRVKNNLKPHRLGSIRQTWPYNRP